MTAKCLPWIVTLYCAVCHCYYDNQGSVQAEVNHIIFIQKPTNVYLPTVLTCLLITLKVVFTAFVVVVLL